MDENVESTFWDPDFYKKTTKRMDDGHKLCVDFIAMLEDRAEIEKNYSKCLQSWSKKWTDNVTKGPEQGEMVKGWMALLEEAGSLADIHSGVRQGLEEYVIENIKLWSKESYHKGLVFVKEKKDVEESFKKIQKPWANQLLKVKKCKSLYYDACKNERKSKKFKENGTLALSEEQIKKIDDRINRAQEEASRCRDNYMTSIQELNEMSPKYLEDMKFVFKTCQTKEAQRLNFFTETLIKIHSHIDISRNNKLSPIYDKYLARVNNLNHEKDLEWWSIYLGDRMPFKPPKFEEYFEVTEPTKKGNSLLRTVIRNDNSVYKSTTMPKSSFVPSSSSKSLNRIGNDAIIKTKRPVRVRALYDYVSNAPDELSLKEGDEFDKLEDEDELGWSKGLKEGKTGLYPANYVEPIFTPK